MQAVLGPSGISGAIMAWRTPGPAESALYAGLVVGTYVSSVRLERHRGGGQSAELRVAGPGYGRKFR